MTISLRWLREEKTLSTLWELNGSSFEQTWIPSSKDVLCQVWLKLVQWVWRRPWKCEKFTTTIDNGKILFRKAHLSLWLRWAKNESKQIGRYTDATPINFSKRFHHIMQWVPAFSYCHIYGNNWTTIARGFNPPPLIFFNGKSTKIKYLHLIVLLGDFKHINSVFLYKIFPRVLFFSFSKETGPKTNQLFISKGK